LIMGQPSRTTQKTYSKRKDATVHWTPTWQGLPCTLIPFLAVAVWHPRSVARCTGRLCVSCCTPSTQWSSLQLENQYRFRLEFRICKWTWVVIRQI
jgi:hypothetical protein